MPPNLQCVLYLQVPNLKKLVFLRHQPFNSQPAQSLVRPPPWYQTGHNHKIVVVKTVCENKREEVAREKTPPEQLHTLNRDTHPQDKSAHSHGNKEQPDEQLPPLTVAAQELINNDNRGSTKVTYKSKSKVGVFAT